MLGLRDLLLQSEIFETAGRRGKRAERMIVENRALLEWSNDDVLLALHGMLADGLVRLDDNEVWWSTRAGVVAREAMYRRRKWRARSLSSGEGPIDDVVLALVAAPNVCEIEHGSDFHFDEELISLYLLDQTDDLVASLLRLEARGFVAKSRGVRHGPIWRPLPDGLREYARVARALGLDEGACILDPQPDPAVDAVCAPETPQTHLVLGPRSTSDDARFTWHEILGAGDYGEVWRATDTKLGREVAIKCISHAATTRASDALAHARALAPLNHPNIVVVYEVLEHILQPQTDGYCDAVVMEHVQGAALDDWLRTAGPSQPPSTIQATCVGMLDALQYLHEKSMLHGDLHAGNVLITQAGAKLIDVVTSSLARSRATLAFRQARDCDDCFRLISQILRSTGFSSSLFEAKAVDRTLHSQRVAVTAVLESQ